MDPFDHGAQVPGIEAAIQQLRTARTGLIRTYMLHVIWFTAMCTTAALQWNAQALQAAALLALVTVPPVLFYTVKVHRLCRAIDPKARTVGLVPVLLTTFVLSPFESGLVMPLSNLLVANRVLRMASARQRAGR